MIAFLRMLLGSGCVLIAAMMIVVALRQYRREITWRRTRALVRRIPGEADAELLWRDGAGHEHRGRHWGVPSTVRTGAQVTLLVHPNDPERIAIPFGTGLAAVLAISGIAVGLLGLLMLSNAVWS